MATEETLKRIEERLTRLEATLTQQGQTGGGGFNPPGGAVVDPAPWPGGGWGGYYHTRPWPGPITDPAAYARAVVDPAPWGGGGGGGGYHPWPHPIVDPAAYARAVVDPAPWGGGGGGYPRWPHPIVDPAAWASRQFLPSFGPTGGDPPPPDISRFNVQQLESSLHSINAEKARLNSMETMIKQQLETLKKQQG